MITLIGLSGSLRRQSFNTSLLRAAAGTLPPMHPDGACAASHLRAIEERRLCDCGEPSHELGIRLEQFIRERVGGDFVDRIEISEAGGVSVTVNRSLAPAERRSLEDALDLARAELRLRMRELYG